MARATHLHIHLPSSRAADTFEESKHPRAPDGSGSGGSAAKKSDPNALQTIAVVNKNTGKTEYHHVHPSRAFEALNHFKKNMHTKSASIVVKPK